MKQVASTSREDYRRFEVMTMHSDVRERSQTTLSQSRIIHVMEYINLKVGKATKRDKKTVLWYEQWYQQIFQSLTKRPETPFDHLVDVSNQIQVFFHRQLFILQSYLPSLIAELVKHLNKENFLAIMTGHKNLITKKNLEIFRCNVPSSQESGDKVSSECVYASE
jgi:hypothetical protein